MSKTNGTYDLFTASGCLSVEALKKSASSTLSLEEQKSIGTHLEDCELCRDALDGIALMSDPNSLSAIVNELNESIEDKYFNKIEKKPIKRIWSNNRVFYFATAASIIILVGLFSFLQFQLEDTDSKISVVIEKPSEEILKPQTPIIKEAENVNTDDNSEKGTETEETEINIEQEPKPEEPKAIQVNEDEFELDVNDLVQQEGFEAKSIDEEVIASPESSEPIEIEEDADLAKADEVVDKDVEGMAMTMEATGSKKSNRQEKSGQKEEDYIGLDQLTIDDMTEDEWQVFTVVESMPSFPGGEEELNNFLAKNIKYPKQARESGIHGRVMVTFVIEKDGKIKDARVLRGIGSGCDEEALRVIKKMPKWIPGTQRGQAVRVQYNVPVLFILN